MTFRVSLTVRVKGMTMSGKCATTLPSFGEQEGRHLVLGVHPMWLSVLERGRPRPLLVHAARWAALCNMMRLS